MRSYKKPPLTFDQQIDLLKRRGLIISDSERTKRHLSNVSYFRMSAYMLPFKENGIGGKPTDQFIPGTSWDDVYDLYKFDRKLRLLIFDAIERVEVALRTQVIYQLSHKYGSHWQDNRALFSPAKTNHKTGREYNVYDDIQKHIGEQLTSNKKARFIEHYLATYNIPPTPPCWMTVELLYFSELSKICQNLKDRKDRTDIAKAFGLIDDRVFCSRLHTLNYIRNICAHHARLCNIDMDITPARFFIKKSTKVWLTDSEVNSVSRNKLFYSMCVILFLLETINPKTHFLRHFKDLLLKYPKINLNSMGFPAMWETYQIWQDPE